MTTISPSREAMLMKVLLLTVGFLVGLGTAHVTTMAKVATNCVKIDIMNKSIEKNTMAAKETLDLIEAVVRQNNALISMVVKEKP